MCLKCPVFFLCLKKNRFFYRILKTVTLTWKCFPIKSNYVFKTFTTSRKLFLVICISRKRGASIFEKVDLQKLYPFSVFATILVKLKSCWGPPWVETTTESLHCALQLQLFWNEYTKRKDKNSEKLCVRHCFTIKKGFSAFYLIFNFKPKLMVLSFISFLFSPFDFFS